MPVESGNERRAVPRTNHTGDQTMSTAPKAFDLGSRLSDSDRDSLQRASHTKNESLGRESSTPDVMSRIIPYKNPPALIAYYLGVLAMIPVIGVFFGVPAFVLGVIGLDKQRANSAVKGSVHAWVGIVVGGLCSLIWSGVLIFIACCFLLYGPQAASLLKPFGG